MSEEQWLACEDPCRMLRALGTKASVRKLRLFACACCRRVMPLLVDAEGRDAVSVAERYADGAAAEHERAAAEAAAHVPYDDMLVDCSGGGAFGLALGAVLAALEENAAFVPSGGQGEALSAAEDSCECVTSTVPFGLSWVDHGGHTEELRQATEAACRRERREQAALVRCVFGSPGSRAADALASDPTALLLAQAAYEERIMPSGELEPARLAVLADALEEAGCANEDILSHLRGAGPHVRGCWALDLILGKE